MANLLQLVVACLFLVAVSNALTETEFKLARFALRAPRGSGGSFTEETCKPENKHVCYNCTSFKMCMGGNDGPIVACTGSTPYCREGQCSSTLNDDAACQSPFECTAEGYMPDPDDCAKFYFCPGKDKPAVTYTCPVNFAYNPPSLMCKPKKSATDCNLLKCAAGKQFATYAPNKAYYGYCDADGTTVYRCPDTQYQTFDETAFDCVFTCPREGVFPDSTNNKAYIVCYNINSKLIAYKEKCPDQHKFNPETAQCEKETATPPPEQT